MPALNLASSGLDGLDKVIQHLRLGDNVVWQVDNLEDYLHFALPYVERALTEGKKLIYIRFAEHPPLIADPRVTTYQLDPAAGFESFSKQLHEIITQEGKGVYYLFDSLSDLLSTWATDLMIGNFFMVTCPYLFQLDTVAYFAIIRNNHSYKTIARIRETTQLLFDVYRLEGEYYLHPLKVWNRYSPTMFLPHLEQQGTFLPLKSSVDAARLFSYMSDKGEESASRNLDYWDRLFLQAEEVAGRSNNEVERRAMVDRLCRVMIGREERMLALVKKYFTLEDLLEIKNRLIGSGYIGGKALGMLLARKILQPEWGAKLEPHDSFYIGSDVFYTYIVQNGWWQLWLEQKTSGGFFEKAAELKDKLLGGAFPDELKEQFNQLLEYFGQSPIIVRSSSLLEDGFGNAFAGKYESIFCVNQGSPEVRYAAFEETIRQVFASTMNEDALTYRRQRGLGEQDEQMALLVQRVSGRQYQHSFFPYLAGVGVSYNTFVWQEGIDPQAGMLRLVFGLGTRAVNRVEGDYPRLVALDQPLLRPYAGEDDLKRFSQHEVDILDIEKNELVTVDLQKLLAAEPEVKVDKLGRRQGAAGWVLDFDQYLKHSSFVPDMRGILKTLSATYDYPVDVEFTVNFSTAGEGKINILQCRPLQAKGEGAAVKMPGKIKPSELLFSSSGNFMGGNVALGLARVILVELEPYRKLLLQKKYQVARLIGKLNRQLGDQEKTPTMLIGPGRWGTRDATLGVPVSFAEINNFSVLVETADEAAGFMPELSFGSHFFLDLVEGKIFYLALFPGRPDVVFDLSWLRRQKNIFSSFLPEEEQYSEVIKVFELAGQPLRLLSDITSQRVVCLKK